MKQLSFENVIDAKGEKNGGANGVGGDRVIVKELETVMHESMMPYAEHVILDRALPRVEDGLKPVQRRILYTMQELALMPDKPYKKSARIVGDCLGKYHPHGDSSVYDAMVRMAQDFSLNHTLVDGQGNFGSIDGDSAAAMRYTEVRLSPLALELLRDLEKDTVRFVRNFDDSTKEPEMLPGRYPNLLVNGASGIAVGLATNIPPHNLGEVIAGAVAYLDEPRITLNQMLKIIQGPDFPTGGYVLSGEGLRQAYETGRGKILLRAEAHLEGADDEKQNIVITQLPYQVNKSKLLVSILDLRDEKKELLSGIAEIIDESDKSGMRAVIRIKKDADARKILDLLYKHTDLEVTFGINMVAIAEGVPLQMSLLDIIAYYCDYQKAVVLARTKFELAEAEARRHILEGLIIAVSNIDAVVAIIKKSAGTVEAKQNLRAAFALSEVQAQAILDLRLARLTKLEIEKLKQEIKELLELIERLQRIVGSKRELKDLVKSELLAISRAHKRPRKSRIVTAADEIVVENASDEKPAERAVLVLCRDGSLRALARMPRKVEGADGAGGNAPVQIIEADTARHALIFGSKGNCFKLKIGDLPLSKGAANGISLTEAFGAEGGERAVRAFLLPEDGVPEGEVLVFTKNGFVKRSGFAEYASVKSAFVGMKFTADADEVIGAEVLEAGRNILCVTSDGMGIKFDAADVPVQGRVAGGVRAVNLQDGAHMVLGTQVKESDKFVIITDKMFTKRCVASGLNLQKRYGKGLIVSPVPGVCGKSVVLAAVAQKGGRYALSDGAGTVILTAEEIPEESRTGSGKPPAARARGTSVLSAAEII